MNSRSPCETFDHRGTRGGIVESSSQNAREDRDRSPPHHRRLQTRPGRDQTAEEGFGETSAGEEESGYLAKMAETQEAIIGAFYETSEKILELAKNAETLWFSRSPEERVNFLKMILSNQVLDGVCPHKRHSRAWRP